MTASRQHFALAGQILSDKPTRRARRKTAKREPVITMEERREPFVPSFLRSQTLVQYGDMAPSDWNSLRHTSL